MNSKKSKNGPKMGSGRVHAYYVRCGRDNCRCATNREFWHGPYFALRKQSQGKRTKTYLGTRCSSYSVSALAQDDLLAEKRKEELMSSETAWRTVRDSLRQVQQNREEL